MNVMNYVLFNSVIKLNAVMNQCFVRNLFKYWINFAIFWDFISYEILRNTLSVNSNKEFK